MGNTETHHSYYRASTPEKDTIVIQKDPTAYTFLYASLGFAGLVFLLLVIGFFWNTRKSKQKEAEAQANAHRGFLPSAFPEIPESETCRESSFFDGRSVTLSSVQPKSDLGYNGVDYPHAMRYPDGTGRGMTFGCYRQQTPQPPQQMMMMHHADSLLETLDGPGRNQRSDSKGDARMYVPGRHESLDVYYKMEPEEKTPLQKQMDNKKEFKSYLHLTSELSRTDSLDEEGDAERTLPLKRSDSSDYRN